MADLDDRPTASPVERIGPLGLSVGQRARRTQTVTAKEDVVPGPGDHQPGWHHRTRRGVLDVHAALGVESRQAKLNRLRPGV